MQWIRGERQRFTSGGVLLRYEPSWLLQRLLQLYVVTQVVRCLRERHVFRVISSQFPSALDFADWLYAARTCSLYKVHYMVVS